VTSARKPPKILPSAIEIVRNVREVTRDVIAPTLASHSERSAAATIDHMLRYVERLLAGEGQALLDEEARLKALLPRVAGWLDGRPGMAPLAAAIRETVAATRDPAVYPALTIMEDDVAMLRQHVCDALVALNAAGDDKGAEGEAVHAALRDYIRWQIATEGKLVEPAFLGHGPRR
jgi:hypothetical protein